MATPFMGEVKVISFGFAPKGWALCNGQLMQINQNQALFSLLGTTYGGDGRVTFALPDMRDRTPIYVGNGHVQGERGGETAHTLNTGEMPAHTHFVVADTTPGGGTPSGTSRLAASSSQQLWATPTGLIGMSPAVVGNAGGSQPHSNVQPYTVLNFIIALQGIFPSRN